MYMYAYHVLVEVVIITQVRNHKKEKCTPFSLHRLPGPTTNPAVIRLSFGRQCKNNTMASLFQKQNCRLSTSSVLFHGKWHIT